MSIQVMTDGSVDLPQEVLDEYDIPVVHPIVIIEGKSFLSRVEISLPEFFEQQRTARVLPSTSQPAPGQFVEAFEQALQRHDQILYIGVSSGLSGTVNSAQQAASQFPEGKIVIHDSLTISGAAGFQVIAAAKAVARGGSLDEALAAARRAHEQTELVFAVDDLTYLIKGGRVGRVAGAVGSFLDIKPIITVDKRDGKFQPGPRVRSFKGVMRRVLDLASERIGDGKPGRFMVLYGDMHQEASDFAAQLRQRFDARALYTTTVAPTLGAHTGPRALGLAFAPGDWG